MNIVINRSHDNAQAFLNCCRKESALHQDENSGHTLKHFEEQRAEMDSLLLLGALERPQILKQNTQLKRNDKLLKPKEKVNP